MEEPEQNSTLEHESYVLLLAKEKNFAADDYQILSNNNIKNILFMDEGIKAASMLHEKYIHQQKLPNIILCHDQLKDMSGISFIQLLELHPYFTTIPTLILTPKPTIIPSNTKHVFLNLPYSNQELIKAISIAQKSIQNPSIQSDTTLFEKKIQHLKKETYPNKKLTIHDAYISGLKAIKEKNFKDGIIQLQYVIKMEPKHTNALLALSIAWKEQGYIKEYIEILNTLLSIYVEKQQWNQAKNINKRLMLALDSQSNPLYDKAYHFLSDGSVSKAAQAIMAGRISSDQDDYMYEKLLHGCLKTYSPYKTIQKLKSCLLKLGDTILTEKITNYLEQSIPKYEREKKQLSISIPTNTEKHIFLLSNKPKEKNKKQNERPENIEQFLMKKLEPSKVLNFAPKIQEFISVFKYTNYLLHSLKNKKIS